MTNANPLLKDHILPPFKSILPEHIVEAVSSRVGDVEKVIDHAVKEGVSDVQAFLSALEHADDRLDQTWSPVSHLNGVMNSDDLRQAYEAAQQLLTEHWTKRGQNAALYQIYKNIKESDEYKKFELPRQKAIQNTLRGFKLSGVALQDKDKQRYGEIKSELSRLTTAFSNNVLDASNAWSLHVEDSEKLSGMPEHALAAAAERAKEKNMQGYLLTLDQPVYLTVMTQADDRDLRKTLYLAFNTRASDTGPDAGKWDNSNLIEQILKLRWEQAKLLGFESYADLSLATKMAETPAQVINFLEDLLEKSKEAGKAEYRELCEFARREYQADALQAWDIPYYSEKLKLHQFAISQEALRPYFPLEHVQNGMFELMSRLFKVQFTPREEVETWHKDARYFEVSRNGKAIAGVYVDLFARPKKRGGAWMAECRVRRKKIEGQQNPVAFVVCNFNAPLGDTPSLLTHNEVTTLFHEFGHAMHHMFTTIDEPGVSGINGVAWDAVELPSQFFENFCWEEEVLSKISSHYQSGQPLPQSQLEKLLAAKNFQSAMFMLRQLEFALFDFKLHLEFGQSNFKSVQALLDGVREKVCVYPIPEENRFQHSFSHIFAGGYAAGYYSYKWAEVLSADVFAAFEEEGIFNPDTGQRYLNTILENGGSRDAMELFVDFRGRKPSVDALLRHSGMLPGTRVQGNGAQV